MKADLTLDFEALLTAAQAQWKLREQAIEPLSKRKYSLVLAGRSMQDPEYQELEMQEIDAKIKYQRWIKENLTERGIMYATQHADGKPKTLFVIVAGADSHILSAT